RGSRRRTLLDHTVRLGIFFSPSHRQMRYPPACRRGAAPQDRGRAAVPCLLGWGGGSCAGRRQLVSYGMTDGEREADAGDSPPWATRSCVAGLREIVRLVDGEPRSLRIVRSREELAIPDPLEAHDLLRCIRLCHLPSSSLRTSRYSRCTSVRRSATDSD